ncbi:LuxR C-terminal-related transcriptional regulator [Nocardia sp. NPDC049220]|uniref:ATP-binding protein n=1 Tax=Nocardia sp. NPDC049220 TaxID=3155273 RepID=UPI0033D404ED
MITLLGPGGIGKTRLATAALGRFGKASNTPVFWVRLARLAKGADAVAIEEEATASVVEADFSGRSGWEALVDTLTRTDESEHTLRTVLVMDNCEHVLTGAGHVIAELLAAVPGLTIVATSREAIGWVDEHVVVVPPLTREQAVTLFKQRAEFTGHPIADADEGTVVGLICGRAHNHPLCVRLAAARLMRQPLAMIVRELSGEATDRRLRWSHGPRVGAERRHQGVRSVIAWSYDLCSDKEQLLLDRMSVFAAGYDTNPEDHTCSALDVGADLEAIEAVCADEPAPEPDHNRKIVVGVAADDVEGLLERLVDQSLVTAHITPNAVRYSMLECIRLFTRQQLEERSTVEVDEPARFEQRHRRYYRDKVVHVQRNWFSPAEQDLLNWARAACDNIMTAIETSLTAGEPVVGLEISAGLISLRASFFKGSLRELLLWTERALRATRTLTPQPIELQVEAMTLIGWLSLLQGNNEDAEQILEDCVTACIDDPKTRQNWRRTPESDIGLPAPVEFVWGVELMFAHRDPKAIPVLARALEKYRALGVRGGEARSEWHQALAASLLGSAGQAMEITRRHLEHAADAGAWSKAWAELPVAIALTKHGDPKEALTVGYTILAHQVAVHDQWGAVWTIHVRIWSLAQVITDSIAAGSTDGMELRKVATKTAQLAGAAARLSAELGVSIDGLGPVAYETSKAVDIARQMLGPDAFAAAQQQGSRLRPEFCEVQRLALGTLSIEKMPMDHPARENTSSHWGELTAAEQQVATLAAAGWTNAAIAARRGISRRTVDAQMAAIFQKLTIASRDDIIGFVPEDQIGEVRTEATRQPHRTGHRPRSPR